MATESEARAHKTIKTLCARRVKGDGCTHFEEGKKEIGILWAFCHQISHPIKVQWASRRRGVGIQTNKDPGKMIYTLRPRSALYCYRYSCIYFISTFDG